MGTPNKKEKFDASPFCRYFDPQRGLVLVVAVECGFGSLAGSLDSCVLLGVVYGDALEITHTSEAGVARVGACPVRKAGRKLSAF